MTREEHIRSLFDSSGRLLEIGAGCNPLFPKRDGYKVETVDHASQEELQEKYHSDPNADWRKIEAVDYVSNGSLLDAIPHRNCFDVIFASNVIEHTPNLIRFLQECEALLSERGKLVLIVPDKRYCFDFFRSLTSTGDIIQAYEENRTRHLFGHLFDHVANFATKNGVAVWGPKSKDLPKSSNNLAWGYDEVRRASETGEYIDTHAWIFTPSSFRMIIQDINSIGLCSLNEEIYIPSISWYEFLVILSKDGEGCGIDRQTLLKMTEEELRRPSRLW